MSRSRTRSTDSATRRRGESPAPPGRSASSRSSGTAERATDRGAGASSAIGAGARGGLPADVVAAALLVAVALVAYLPAIGGGFVWDDDAYVSGNVTLRDLDGLRRIWLEPGAVPQYYPLTFTTFWIEYQLFGAHPLPYHATNVALHLISAVLLGFLLRRLAVPGAWLGAALFALHPVQVESVAWIAERKNVLSGVLYVGALTAYLTYAGVLAPLRTHASGGPRGAAGAAAAPPAGSAHPRRWYALALVLFVAALLSKTVTCTLPAAIVIILWWKHGRVGVRDLLALAPFFAIGLGLGLFTVWMEKHHVGAVGAPWQLSLVDRVLVAGRVLWFYATTLVWPVGLTFVYPRWHVDAAVWWQYLFPLAAAAVLVGLYTARARLGRGAVAAVAFFAVTLLPALGFFDVYPMRYSFVADHFQYHASAGLLVLAAAVAATWAARLPAPSRSVATTGAAVIVAVLAVLTWRQGRLYAGEESLWRATIARNPGASMAHLNLGMLLARDGRLDEAIGHYRQTLAIDGEVADAHNNIGNALMTKGDVTGAIEEFRAGVRAAPADAPTWVNLGNALATAGRYDEARNAYDEALRLRPAYADAHANLGTALAREGRSAEAIARLREAVRLDPGYVQARLNLAQLLAASGAGADAAREYGEVLARRPDSAPALLGLAWLRATAADARVRDGAQATALAERARRIAGEDAGALDTLAAALAESGRFDEARRVGARAAALADGAGDAGFAAAIRARLIGYEAGTPYREG